MSPARLVAAALTCAALLAGFATTPVALARARCSTTGLGRHHVNANGSETGYRILRLFTSGTSCRQARHIAFRVGRSLYGSYRAPRRVDRFRIVARIPCAGCAPRVPVTATRKRARVTFAYWGGA